MLSPRLILSKDIIIQLIPSNSTSQLVINLAEILHLESSDEPPTNRIFISLSDDWNEDREPIIQCTLEDQWNALLTLRSRIRVWQKSSDPDYYFEVLATQEELGSNDHFRIGMIVTIIGAIWVLFSEFITLLHGALVTRNSYAVALIGPSGAGKSRAAMRIPHPWRAISDDITVVVKNSEGGYVAHPLPTWSAFFDKPGPLTSVKINRGYPLKKIYFLEKSDRDACIPIPPSVALNRIIQYSLQVYAMYWDNIPHNDVFELKRHLLLNARQIVQTIDTAVLQVSKDGAFWDYMD